MKTADNNEARIIKVEIDSYTQQPHYFIKVIESNTTFWTFESNIVSWKEMKDFTPIEKEIFAAANERAKQLRAYYKGENVAIDNNPLNKFKEYLNSNKN
jgi:hypothetical protein